MKDSLKINADHDIILIDEIDVRNMFSCLKINKASGPDSVGNIILKICSHQLSGMFTKIFQLTLDRGVIPQIWKTSMIVPVPKSSKVSALNDYRPVALTSSIMKCLEKLVSKFLLKDASSHLDKFQFAYRCNRGVDDGVLVFLHKLYSHLDKPKSYARSMLIYFSSAFNTIQPHILILKKLMQINVSPKIVQWIHNFLLNRPQWVKIGDVNSKVRITNTGAPQGCVISPLLCSFYTSDCLCSIPKSQTVV